jgi:hypothetical protein
MTAHRACWPRIRRVSLAALFGAACVLLGCSTPPLRDAQPPAPEAPVPAAIWETVGAEIPTLAAAAAQAASDYARAALERWLERVLARTESDFIPWATNYWTHQWLALKLAWYRTDDSIDDRAAMGRLTDYLHDAYRSKVLEPVAREIDPLQIMDQASGLYASALAAGLDDLRERQGVPRHQFGNWLNGFPAISSPPGASLRDLVEAGTVGQLAAYQSLTASIRRAGDTTDVAGDHAALRSVAQRTAERLSTTLAVRGGAAASSLLGGVPGALVGVAITAWDATTHEQERPALEAALRSDLDATLRKAQWTLLSDPGQGVLAPVAHIAEQLNAAFPEPFRPPLDDADAPEALF